MTPVRAAAARAVAAVAAGRTLGDALDGERPRVAGADTALLQELAYGTVRHWHRLEPVLRARLRKPLKMRDADVRALMLVALYELAEMRTPAHAAVDAAVEAIGALGRGKDWARGLVNGVLRGVLRDSAALEAPADPAGAHAWPEWLAQSLQRDWPDDWSSIAASGTARPPMTLRVNETHVTRGAYLERLRAAGIGARETQWSPVGLTLEEPVAVDRLPGFAAGDVSVQDEAAQLSVPLLAPVGDCRVLDACAAPGGKTAHLAEWSPPPAAIVAVESDPERAQRLDSGLRRLGVAAEIVVADAAAPGDWRQRGPFERILLDVPCSGSGVVRRHPDIKLLRRSDDIDAFVAQQQRLLDGVWPLLAPGGMLLYTTCSILRRENEAQISAFLQRHSGARAAAPAVSWGRVAGDGRQVLPGESGMDGFYYACLYQPA
ncbi:MAG: 16S rRNA (cytosine(967)-C(5))-methyltransferase RsmB [Halofilum sp. (in: g-proteobacteria)]